MASMIKKLALNVAVMGVVQRTVILRKLPSDVRKQVKQALLFLSKYNKEDLCQFLQTLDAQRQLPQKTSKTEYNEQLSDAFVEHLTLLRTKGSLTQTAKNTLHTVFTSRGQHGDH